MVVEEKFDRKATSVLTAHTLLDNEFKGYNKH